MKRQMKQMEEQRDQLTGRTRQQEKQGMKLKSTIKQVKSRGKRSNPARQQATKHIKQLKKEQDQFKHRGFQPIYPRFHFTAPINVN